MACPKEKIIKMLMAYEGHIATTCNADNQLTIGPHSIPLFTRVRNYRFDYDWNLQIIDGNCIDLSTFSDNIASNILDSWEAIDSEIIYIDPRYDHVVYRETAVQITYGAPITTYNSIPQYAFFNDLPITVVKTIRTISSLLGVLEESAETINKTINLCVAYGIGHLTAQFVDEKYYSYDEAVTIADFDNPERDGWGWTYPVYLHGYFAGSDIDREYAKLIDIYQFSAPVSDTTIEERTPVEPVVDDFPQGSWAFDRDGNMFVSQKLHNSVYNLLRSVLGTDSNPVLLTNTIGNNPIFYPVAPI